MLVGAILFAEELADKYTNKSSISIKGEADPNVIVEIFIDQRKIKEINADENGEWLAKDITLKKQGLNKIYAKTRDEEGNKSKISSKVYVVYDITPPKIYECKVNPQKLRPGDVLRVDVRTDDDVDSVTAIMPDNSVINLEKGDAFWTQTWVVPGSITGGSYQALIMAMDRAGNLTQKNTGDVYIDAATILTIATPENNSISYDEVVNVKGFATNSKYVLINGDKYQSRSDGSFSGFAKLKKPGRNQIIVQAIDASGLPKEGSVSIIKLITFPDIKHHLARREIEYLATLGIVQAYPNTNIFAPDQPITREELAALMVRSRDYQVNYNSISSFIDVRGDDWAVNYIEAAARNGLVIGYPKRLFKPKNNITRAEAVTMFVRYANVPQLRVMESPYLDVSRDSWHAPYIASFKVSGLLPEFWKNSERFYPDRPITRAEICAILARVSEINQKIEILLGGKTNWDYVVDSSAYRSTVDEPLAVSQWEDSSTIVVGIISPQEVLKGNDLKLSVATLVKMRRVVAVLPDERELPLQFNRDADLWETNWKVPGDFKEGDYKIDLIASGIDDKTYRARSSRFSVVGAAQKAKVFKERKKAGSRETEFVYAEYIQSGMRVPGLETPMESSIEPLTEESMVKTPYSSSYFTNEGTLTRARMAEILAEYGKLRKAKVSGPPASDVPLTHPQVNYIKSAIVTGIIPNVSRGKFDPNGQVTKDVAKDVINKAYKRTIVVNGGAGTITEADFKNMLIKE